jgi:hypothetical protein
MYGREASKVPLERNNVVNSFKADVETRLDNDRYKDTQTIGEVAEDNDVTNVEEQGEYFGDHI